MASISKPKCVDAKLTHSECMTNPNSCDSDIVQSTFLKHTSNVFTSNELSST